MNRKNLAAGIFWLAIAGWVILESVELGLGTFPAPGPGFVLCGAGLLLGILSLVLTVQSLCRPLEGKRIVQARSAGLWMKVIVTIAALSLYASFLTRAGFILATLGLMIVLYLVGRYKPWMAIVNALVTVALSYALFHFALHVQFPRGPFTW